MAPLLVRKECICRKVLDLNTFLPEHVWKDVVGLVSEEMGEAAGSRRIYVNIDELPRESEERDIPQPFPPGRILPDRGNFFSKPAGELITGRGRRETPVSIRRKGIRDLGHPLQKGRSVFE